MQENLYQPPAAEAGVRPLSDGEYEFSVVENGTIDKVGSRARIWGIISLVVGVLVVVALVVVFAMAGQLGGLAGKARLLLLAFAPVGLVYLVMGWLYITAGQAMRDVVATQGKDVEHLMQGLDKLGSAFRLEVILTIVAVVAGFVLGMAMAGSNAGLGGAP
jgi:ABC-type Na+ efflux pump permease subunit